MKKKFFINLFLNNWGYLSNINSIYMLNINIIVVSMVEILRVLPYHDKDVKNILNIL